MRKGGRHLSTVFKRKLRKGREWKNAHLAEWAEVLQRNYIEETEKLYGCEGKVSVRACSAHPNEHPKIFKTHHCDSPFCPVCTIRRWEKETIDIYEQLKGLSKRYFHIVFTLPPEIRDNLYRKEDFKRFRKVVRDTLKATVGGTPGGPMSMHVYGDQEPGIMKPHIHVIIPALTILPDGTIKRFPYIPQDVLKEEYLKRLKRRFKTPFKGIPVVYIQWFPETKLYHRVRYLVHPPFEISDIEGIDMENNEISLTVTGEHNHRKKKVRVSTVRILRALHTDRKRGHRYQWFGFMSYNSRERYRRFIEIPYRRKPGKAKCSVCGADTVHIGYIDSEGLSISTWLDGDFLGIFKDDLVMEEFRKHPPPDFNVKAPT